MTQPFFNMIFFKIDTFYKIILISILLTNIGCASSQLSEEYISEIAAYRHKKEKELTTPPNNPLTLETFKKVGYFELNAEFICTCEVTITPSAKPFEMSTYSGIKKPYRKYADLICSTNNKPIKLSVYENLRVRNIPGLKDLLFLPFKDITNGESSYGGGRYINIPKKEIVDLQLIVDFNKAYNPYCAYSDGFNCPIPPRENHLDISILAGEKAYLK